MYSKNTYTGINPKFVRNIQSEARSLKRHPAYAHKYLQDIEQDLFLDCLPGLEIFKGAKEKFIKNYIKCRARSLLEKELCKKRAINFVDETLHEERDESFEYSLAVRIDVQETISKLPPELKKICELLEEGYNICEISRKIGIPKTTLYEKVERLGEKGFSHLKTYLSQDF